MFFVYVHRRPNGSPFYVGKATYQSRAFLFKHRSLFHKRIVAKYGVENITVSVLEFATEKEAFAAEIEYIARFRAEGHRLANLTDGGDGAVGFVHSEEERKRRAAFMTGRKPLEATRKLWSEQRKGRRPTEETRRKLSLIRTGKSINQPLRPWQAPIISARFKGVPKSEAHKAKIAAAHLGKIQGPASEETKAKMSVAQSARYADPANRAEQSRIMRQAWKKRRFIKWMKAALSVHLM